MTKQEIKDLCKEHGIDIKKCKNLPNVLEKLPYVEGELLFGFMSEDDKFQLLTRYLNDECVYQKNLLLYAVRIEKLLTWLLESRGIDVNRKFKEDAKLEAEKLEQRIAESKEKLVNSVK